MSRIHISIEQMWWSNKKPPALLKMASYLYKLINHHNLTSRKNRAASPPLPMISVGNITAGGSGKTPFVIWLAGQLISEGFRPVILCRGDGGKADNPELLNNESDPFKLGDEAVLLHQLSGCPVIAGRDRIESSRMAAEYGDIIILDDGFQYRQLERICDIVLIPAEGVGNAHLIPAGPLREPLEALGRADLLVRTGNAAKIKPTPISHFKEWRWWTEENTLIQLNGDSKQHPGHAVALTAIARPQRFIQSLDKLEIEIKETFFFPDHHPFSMTDIQTVLHHDLPVIVTGKDAVKLKGIWPDDKELWLLKQTPEAEPGLFEAIKEKLVAAL